MADYQNPPNEKLLNLTEQGRLALISKIESLIKDCDTVYSYIKNILSKDSNRKLYRNFNQYITASFSDESEGNLGLHNFWFINISKIKDGYSYTEGDGEDGRGNFVFGYPNNPSQATQYSIKNYSKSSIFKRIEQGLNDYGDILDGDFNTFFNNFAANTKLDYYQYTNLDIYVYRAAGSYLWQNIFQTKNINIADKAAKYLNSLYAIKVYGLTGYYGGTSVFLNTIPGAKARFQGILDKLKDYDAINKKMIPTFADNTAEENQSEITLANYLDAILSKVGINFNIDELIQSKYGSGWNYSPTFGKAGFFRVVRPNEDFINLDAKYAKNIWNKIKNSGLIELALSADFIGEFAQKRFVVGKNGLEDPVKGSAANALNPVRDTVWLTDLSKVITNLTRDPFTLNIVQLYFPNLATLFFAAAAVASDYSGKDESDPINNWEEMAKSLLGAFGTDEDGNPIFRPAWEMQNTGMRIKQALEQFPFRENIPPQTPDIFHFRLGAANFYVPPVSINVSSQFKTGSLTGGAIRQKNSPKYNAGYKETTINIKLFFPNYEEIWGIDIDGIKDITLDKDFKIDFKLNGDSEEKIDKFLSSLRGLVAAFKYAPVLPVKNHYLNTVHGITGVALSSMSISTIPNYPFALVVDLELLNFNHKPFLPMIKDFNQAVHWGKFRHYMGKAAGSLHSYINESFLLDTGEDPNNSTDLSNSTNQGTTANETPAVEPQTTSEPDLLTDPFKEDIYKTNVIKEWKNGNNISIYIPAQTQTKIFTPDIQSFRSEEERMLDDYGRGLWDSMLKSIGIDRSDTASYGLDLDSVAKTSTEGSVSPSARRIVLESFELLTSSINKSTFAVMAYKNLITEFILENKSKLNQQEIDYLNQPPIPEPVSRIETRAKTYVYRGEDLTRKINGNDVPLNLYEVRFLIKKSAEDVRGYLEDLSSQIAKDKSDSTNKPATEFLDQAREDVKRAFNVLLYNRFFSSGPIQKLLEAKRARQGSFQFNEWEVPMLRVDLDPKTVIVNGVSVSLGNNLAKMQLQMQEEPTYQHIGGKDSFINISMTVFGEKELIKIRKVFEHINGLARLEHSTGVIGFMGIRNAVAAIAGIKYVVPLSYQVDTIPNFPHVYDVKISFVDFDIYQQKREQLSSDQQRELVKEFKTKRNPFLRIKQLWSAFNAYPDFPLSVKDQNGNVVGNLDPDYYFRSFEMFDSDVINNITTQQQKLENGFIEPKVYSKEADSKNQKRDNAIMSQIKSFIQNNDINGLKEFFEEKGMSLTQAGAYIQGSINEFFSGKKKTLLSDYIETYSDTEVNIAKFGAQTGVGFSSINPNTSAGDIKYRDESGFIEKEIKKEVEKVLKGLKASVSESGEISIDPDELPVHNVINILPAAKDPSDDKIPAQLMHANGYYLGYISKKTNRFYFTSEAANSTLPDNYTPAAVPFTDEDNPAKAYNKTPKGAAHIPSVGQGGANLSEYLDPFSYGGKEAPNAMASKETGASNVAKHWERMLVDTQYRDISGRMIRVFPTYMLWLIDEGGYFTGVKMFDNFYGLQSIVDFSIVQSEDILGDTLILRVSNLYSKLSRPESTSVFQSDEEFNDNPVTQLDQLETVIDTILNRSRNIQSGMMNDYIVDINNIRLKPGVRVHLRGGYGSNPNSLQTLFNGIITQVENGEIVTITAQSDAIELSPIVNSTNKKGDSGKIDGGINTGLWLSEPRDLMVRLLSMGSSRTREWIAQGTRGRIFSENKFGIRHFGSMLYEPLTTVEEAKNNALISAVKDAFDSLADQSGNLWGAGSALGVLAAGEKVSPLLGVGPEVRVPALGVMQTLWANQSSQRDFEIFKRNIYPGNGTGIAQFLGGDLGDGWSTIASITPDEFPNEKLNYIGRVADYSWNNITRDYGMGSADAKTVVDAQTNHNKIITNEKSAAMSKTLIGGGIIAAGTILTGGLGAPVIGGLTAGAGLLGVLSGRAGTNLFNTMGITSGLDDDLPGLDEVSFRAQTYMRSVWDLFQICARLLPNYIVAIRPFEDRSTIFYGKPHWLYTSGVAPLTTGFKLQNDPMSSQAGPNIINGDNVVSKTLQEINKLSNPYADAGAFADAKRSLISLSEEISNQLNGGDNSVYISSSSLSGKIIPFGDKSTMEFRNDKGEVKAKLPDYAGLVTAGYHLPIDPTNGIATEQELKTQTEIHAQVPQLPPRYRFPFFTDRSDNVTLEDYAYYGLSDQIGKWNNHSADYMKLAVNSWSYGGKEKSGPTSWTVLLRSEAQVLIGNNYVDYGLKSNANGTEVKITLATSNIPNFTDATAPSADLYIYSEKSTSASSIIRMPYPDDITMINKKDSAQEYSVITTFNQNKHPASMKEWGSPKTAKQEQFYIAMKWPYKPNGDFNQSAIDEFFNVTGINEAEAVGTVEDYKDINILVYSPITGRAVVCKPAYYMWGKDDVGILNSSYDEYYSIEDDYDVKTEGAWAPNSRNSLGLEKREKLSAIVSPDAAYYLGVMSLTEQEKEYWSNGERSKNEGDWFNAEDAIVQIAGTGLAPFPIPRSCYFAIVPGSVGLGVVPDITLPVLEFDKTSGVNDLTLKQKLTIGFGKFALKEQTTSSSTKVQSAKTTRNINYNPQLGTNNNNGFYALEVDENYATLQDSLAQLALSKVGGNVLASGVAGQKDSYFDLVASASYAELDKQALTDIVKAESGENTKIVNRVRFASVYSESDETARSARALYDQDFNIGIEVLAGNGRTLQQASEIWDQFRSGYHTYEAVKESFQNAYGIDPDDESDLGAFLGIGNVFAGADSAADFRLLDEAKTREDYDKAVQTIINSSKDKIILNDVFKKFGDLQSLPNAEKGTAKDEFDLVFGDFDKTRYPSDGGRNSGLASQMEKNYYEAIELSRQNFIDSNEDSGLINYFNDLIESRIKNIISIVLDGLKKSSVDQEQIDYYLKSIKSPKQLFLFLVGAFRNAMWSDPYARAWLVLKPNRKIYDGGGDKWDFSPVLKIFQAYIDPNNTFAKDKQKFLKLLAQNRGEGTSSANIVGRTTEEIKGFWDANIGPFFTAIGDALSGLVNTFRLSMMQLGYGLSQIGNMTKQANVLNKVLNDSIYYSLGRPGSMLRAVDNPFTREYGEPVIEIREPFQRVHYLSSFSHIIANGIQENLSGVATSITAVSDGKYPVNVALDKSIPSERQIEKTVETGIFFDNAMGSGLLGALHPIMHPLETIRGISKVAQGTPDELLAKRIGLAHLRESLKDIYGGEIIIVGNPDVRPHDLVYLADVYERMYGLFEVEQVVHHFTSELGFITSITPNALVTVNDPSRWMMSSWIGTWLHMQALRNDTRLYMNSLGSGITASGQISVDGLADSLNAQMVGGVQYTHGSSALARDIMADFSSKGFDSINRDVEDLVKSSSAVSSGSLNFWGLSATFATASAVGAVAGIAAAAVVPGAGAVLKGLSGVVGSAAGGSLAWKGWTWIRDNVLDQHGCYIQYLNRNGQPMDAGLAQSAQGMVVGRYHTKKLLPGILGVSTKVKTTEGYSYIRTNDLLKNLGWKEKEINDLVRHISFENALVNSQILRFSGIGPEKAGLNRFFRTLCKVTKIVDGDTIHVVDVLSTNQKEYTVRFEGINTPELNVIKTDIAQSGLTANITNVSVTNGQATFTTASAHQFRIDDVAVISDSSIFNGSFKIESFNEQKTNFTVSVNLLTYASTAISGKATVYTRGSGDLINPKSPGGKATIFTQNAILNKLIVLRVSPNQKTIPASIGESDFDLGSNYNNPTYFEKDIFGSRSLGTIFYRAPQDIIEKIILETNVLFEKYSKLTDSDLTNFLKSSFYITSFETRYDEIKNMLRTSSFVDYINYASPYVKSISENRKKIYNDYINIRILQFIYDKVSEWPNIEWDEYYDDGTPVSLNWELVVNNLANVYTKGLLVEQPSVIDSKEMSARLSQVR